MKNQPKEIFLNLADGVDCDDYNELVEADMGWSTEPCTTDFLRYVREDLKVKDVLTVGLRDQIAIAYMQAQVQAGAIYSTWNDLSGDAYKMADAMLKDRLK